MTLDGYFIAPEPATNDLWLWRERGDTPIPVLSKHTLRDDPDLWGLLVAAALARAIPCPRCNGTGIVDAEEPE